MPIYEFRCEACGHIQEFLTTGSSEEIEMKCSECQGEEMVRVLSSVSYAMGGSGGGAKSEGLSATSRSCGSGNTCSTLTLPGHTR